MIVRRVGTLGLGSRDLGRDIPTATADSDTDSSTELFNDRESTWMAKLPPGSYANNASDSDGSDLGGLDGDDGSAISLCVLRTRCVRGTTAFGKRRPATLIVLLTWVSQKEMRQAGDPGQSRGHEVTSDLSRQPTDLSRPG